MEATLSEKAGPPSGAEGDTSVRARLGRSVQALRMTWDGSPATAGLWLAVLGVSSLLPLGVAWTAKAIVDAVVAQRARDALAWVLIELVLIVSLGAAQRAGSVLRSLLGTRLGLSLNLRILRKAL